MVLPESPEWVEFLSPYPAATQELARTLRNRLVELLPPCIETVWDATNAVGVAYGFTEKNRDHFIHLPVYTRYVNLGFSQGVQLEDLEGRLKGAGARIRHIRLERVEDLDAHAAALVRQAVALAGPPAEPVPPRSIVRVMEGPKRRPRPS
ncbi:MAG: DUF1801 domain-containing protein [Fimbriimonadaceae bacterium]|nr:DUF1801 domain-containing protein [Fimbriimonadaceae bacterium]